MATDGLEVEGAIAVGVRVREAFMMNQIAKLNERVTVWSQACALRRFKAGTTTG